MSGEQGWSPVLQQAAPGFFPCAERRKNSTFLSAKLTRCTCLVEKIMGQKKGRDDLLLRCVRTIATSLNQHASKHKEGNDDDGRSWSEQLHGKHEAPSDHCMTGLTFCSQNCFFLHRRKGTEAISVHIMTPWHLLCAVQDVMAERKPFCLVGFTYWLMQGDSGLKHEGRACRNKKWQTYPVSAVQTDFHAVSQISRWDRDGWL